MISYADIQGEKRRPSLRSWRDTTQLFSSKQGGFGVVSLLLIAVGVVAPAALATDSSVALYSPREALRLARKPVSRMVDDVTCERIEGTTYQNKHPVAGAHGALFRANRRGVSFMRVVTREDGVYVAHFPAKPGEIIYSRAYMLDSRTGKEIYGDETKSACLPGNISVGEPSPVMDAVGDAAPGEQERQ